jgi:DNA (cytosine-5)-methyltransferase 1
VAARDAGAPVGTITAHDRQLGLVMQAGGPTGSGRNPRSTGQPIMTVMPDSHSVLVTDGTGAGGAAADGEVPPALALERMDRGLLVYNGMPGFVRDLGDTTGTVTTRDSQALLVPYFRTGVARLVDEPAGTVTTRDREALVITDADVDDSFLRMLTWQELLRAQAMHRLPGGGEYLLTARRRDGRGRVRELSSELRVRMIGNAVSAPVATMLGWAAFAALR